MLERRLILPNLPSESFFLWGPRQCGKTMLLKTTYPKVHWYDLLKSDIYLRLLENPSLLRQDLLYAGERSGSNLVIIDEVQKLPILLDEVHWLIENTNYKFGLCGSSARKVRSGHANLLGGRALRYELFGLVSSELGSEFDLVRIVNQGYLPRHYLSSHHEQLLRAYASDYLQEEIAAEGLVRNLPAFSQFLRAASLSDTELINYAAIARECSISAPVVKEYFQILVDTMLSRYLQAYQKRPKRRIIGAPKFYFADVGVVNFLAKRKNIEPGSELFGKAMENWVFHELSAHRAYCELYYDLSYWRLAGGTEVDFIINDMESVIEVKSCTKATSDHLRGLREVKVDFPNIKNRYLVCLEQNPRKTEDGIEILPYMEFAQRLWANDLIA